MSNVGNKLLLLVSLLISSALGCEGADVDSANPDSSLYSELAAQPSYEIGSDLDHVVAEAAALRADRVAEVDFEVLSGDVVLAATGDSQISLVDLQIVLGDVSVPSDILPPRGVELTDIWAELAGVVTVDASWNAGGDRVEASIEVDLLLHWAMRRDDRAIPLADIRIQRVPLQLAVERESGRTEVAIRADRRGSFWSWAETFELRDLTIELGAR